jgi:hypothetical protein
LERMLGASAVFKTNVWEHNRARDVMYVSQAKRG